jgi:hypothetical protein
MCGMSRKTSIYLNPQLEQLADTKDQPLAEALYRGLAVEPLLIEEDRNAGLITHWYCTVPAKGTRFKVIHDHWLSRIPPIREIYEIEVTS